jgi:hypothetical protein
VWFKASQDKSSQDPISKIPNMKRTGGMAQGVGPEFKPWYHKKNKTKQTNKKTTHTLMITVAMGQESKHN